MQIDRFSSCSDFQIREANALPIAHTYTVMCVLPINLFNQVIVHRDDFSL